MGTNFIPSFHFENPADKLKPEWAMKAVNYLYYSNANFNLLWGKKVRQIDDFASGDYSMVPFMRMFKSMHKKLQTAPKQPDGSFANFQNNFDTTGLGDWDDLQLSLIVSVLNSAIENMMKLPMDVTCEAQDSLAMKKRKEDIDFLKAKPEIEADLQPLADEMGVGKVDLGTTKNSSVKFSDAPMGLDLNDPEHEKIFTQLFYSLKVTTAFEKFLKQWGNIKNIDMIRRLEVTDHFKYGVASMRGYTSSMTGLPDVDYIHPSRVSCPLSSLPDKSDRTHDITDYWMTVMEMFNHFSNEICDEETLEHMINGKGNDGTGTGYCSCGKNGSTSYVEAKNFNTFRVNLKYIEVKSVDWVGVKKGSNNRSSTTFTDNEKECTNKIWGQNTYGFYWLVNTRYCFGIHRLDFSHRTKGQEAFQNFSTHIYQSQPKSAVELSIAENKMAQIAYIKLQHALIKSMPQGKYINLKFLRNALSGLKNEDNKWTLQDILNLAFEQNIMLGDTEGFEGRNDGQLKPFEEIPGGLRAEVQGYWTTIINARQNIAIITGINQQLTGQNPEELIGLQQLQINSGLNAINYCNIGIQNQFEGLYNNWAYYLQSAIEAGGKTKEAVINYIGEEDTEILEGLDEAPLHEITAEIKFGENYAMMQAYMQQLNFLKSQGVVSTVDQYLLDAVDNPKEKFQKLYFIEQRFKKEQEKIRSEQYANQQAIVQQQGQNEMQVQQQKGQQGKEEIYTQGEVDAKLMQLGGQLGLSKQQIDGLIKKQLQKERNDAQLQKSVRTIQAKEDAKLQTAFQ
jgi:hypothetical protein